MKRPEVQPVITTEGLPVPLEVGALLLARETANEGGQQVERVAKKMSTNLGILRERGYTVQDEVTATAVIRDILRAPHEDTRVITAIAEGKRDPVGKSLIGDHLVHYYINQTQAKQALKGGQKSSIAVAPQSMQPQVTQFTQAMEGKSHKGTMTFA